MDFKLVSDFQPTGDQPQAISELVAGVNNEDKHQVLLGVTGSGKTFSIANVISQVQKPTLILSHNKTLAAQLFGEFKQFFPDNAVEFFVSYYDYYQPEAFIPTTNTYIEKELMINDEIEKFRLSTTSSLLSGRRDIIVIASVSCIYGIGNPDDFSKVVVSIKKGEIVNRDELLHSLVDGMYSRSDAELTKGTFRVKGDVLDIFPVYSDLFYRISFWGNEVESIDLHYMDTMKKSESFDSINIYPANIFVTTRDSILQAIEDIQHDLAKQVAFFNENGSSLEAKRIEDRVTFDMEMMKEVGWCPGIENYSRYFDKRKPGTRPFCLIDYFPDDFLMIIDESHVTVSQVKAMYGGDRSRKQTLVEHGFRLPAAMDNRPLKFDEFEGLMNQIIYVSATPADYELQKSGGVVVEQVIRPTGLLDPEVEIRPSNNQIDDLLEEIDITIKKGSRVLVTTLTKRMAEELQKYLTKFGIKSAYIHSDVDTLERVEIMRDLRLGLYDVLVGVNLLREGLDLPEVALVAILDADKEGFLRSERSLIQTAGRAARNVNSKVILYADKITGSMQRMIDETYRKRAKQIEYNTKYNITPTQITKSTNDVLGQSAATKQSKFYQETEKVSVAADPVVQYMSIEQLEKVIKNNRVLMDDAVKALDFMEAARLRDEIAELDTILKGKK